MGDSEIYMVAIQKINSTSFIFFSWTINRNCFQAGISHGNGYYFSNPLKHSWSRVSILSIENLKQLIEENPKPAIAILLGLEGSAWLHLIKDGDPLPIEWKEQKNQ